MVPENAPRRPPLRPVTLKRRVAFLKAASAGRKAAAPNLVLQALPLLADQQPPGVLLYGLTASRKVGNAVKRNRARRRLRALVREVLVVHASPTCAYVLIARPTTGTCPFDSLRQDLLSTLRRVKTGESPSIPLQNRP